MATRKRPSGWAVACLAAVSALCCSPNNRLVSRRHAWGVNTVVEAAPGRKLVDAMWKGDDLWILTRPAGEGERADREWMLDEYSTWGALNNHILLKEIPR
jgi:hypothetical protein